jgi:hypothetical protein
MSLFAPTTWRVTWKKCAAALDAQLGPGTLPVAVVGAPPLAELLGQRRPVALLDGAGPERLSALVLVLADHEPEPEVGLRAQLTQVVSGGRVVLMGRPAAVELSRLALCAGLCDLESHDLAGRPAVFARVWKIAEPGA